MKERPGAVGREGCGAAPRRTGRKRASAEAARFAIQTPAPAPPPSFHPAPSPSVRLRLRLSRHLPVLPVQPPVPADLPPTDSAGVSPAGGGRQSGARPRAPVRAPLPFLPASSFPSFSRSHARPSGPPCSFLHSLSGGARRGRLWPARESAPGGIAPWLLRFWSEVSRGRGGRVSISAPDRLCFFRCLVPPPPQSPFRLLPLLLHHQDVRRGALALALCGPAPPAGPLTPSPAADSR